MEIIEEIEDERKGTADEMTMSEVEKYQMACTYKAMLQRPNDFKFLLSSGAGTDDPTVSVYLGVDKKDLYFQ